MESWFCIWDDLLRQFAITWVANPKIGLNLVPNPLSSWNVECYLKKIPMSKFTLFIILFILTSCNYFKHEDDKLPVKLLPVKTKMRGKFKRGEEMSNPNNILESKIQTLELDYAVFSCGCANWIKKEDLEKGRRNMEQYIFIEAENPKLELPKNFDAVKNRIKVTGQFYKNKDYPKGMIQGEEYLERAKVFRYYKIELTTK